MDRPTQACAFLPQSYSALQQILLELALPKTRDRTTNPREGKNTFGIKVYQAIYDDCLSNLYANRNL